MCVGGALQLNTCICDLHRRWSETMEHGKWQFDVISVVPRRMTLACVTLVSQWRWCAQSKSGGIKLAALTATSRCHHRDISAQTTLCVTSDYWRKRACYFRLKCHVTTRVRKLSAVRRADNWRTMAWVTVNVGLWEELMFIFWLSVIESNIAKQIVALCYVGFLGQMIVYFVIIVVQLISTL